MSVPADGLLNGIFVANRISSDLECWCRTSTQQEININERRAQCLSRVMVVDRIINDAVRHQHEPEGPIWTDTLHPPSPQTSSAAMQSLVLMTEHAVAARLQLPD